MISHMILSHHQSYHTHTSSCSPSSYHTHIINHITHIILIHDTPSNPIISSSYHPIQSYHQSYHTRTHTSSIISHTHHHAHHHVITSSSHTWHTILSHLTHAHSHTSHTHLTHTHTYAATVCVAGVCVTGAALRASRKGCGAPGRRWAAASVSVAGAVLIALRKGCGAPGRRGRGFCFCGRRGSQSLQKGLRRAWSKMVQRAQQLTDEDAVSSTQRPLLRLLEISRGSHGCVARLQWKKREASLSAARAKRRSNVQRMFGLWDHLRI